MEKTLVIMAAGMGSRFGGLKQIAPIGKNGEILLDYSVYDAVKAGFNKVVFVIKHAIEQDFRAVTAKHIEKMVKKSNFTCSTISIAETIIIIFNALCFFLIFVILQSFQLLL